MPKICIDPGHGGNSNHNVGPTGYVEANGVLKIGLFLKRELESTGAFQVIMTRTTDVDVSISQRVDIAVRNNCDMFVSEHTNAGPSDAGGTEVYYSVDLPGDRGLAESFASAVSGALGIKNRGARTRESNRYPGEDYYGVIDGAQDKGIDHVFIIESAFHTNPYEESLLKNDNYIRKIAVAQAGVISRFYGVPYSGSDGGPVPVPPDPTPTPDPTPVRSENVRRLQRLANDLGRRDMDGRRLVEDGIIGPRTRYAVARLPLAGLPYVQREATRFIQNRLNELGYRDYNGRPLLVDGIFGRRTDAAVRKFQRANGISADGIVGGNTWTKFLYS